MLFERRIETTSYIEAFFCSIYNLWFRYAVRNERSQLLNQQAFLS